MKKKNPYYFLVLVIILFFVFVGVYLATKIIDEESKRQNLNQIENKTEICLKL